MNERLKEDLEKAIVYSNICLRRWHINWKKTPIGYQDVDSLIKGWIYKVFVRNGQVSTDHRARKLTARRIMRSLFFTISGSVDTPPYISSLVLRDGLDVLLEGLAIDFEDLNEKARITAEESRYITSLDQINFDSIKNITF